ncbi:peptidoglycan recognition protein family protein [Paracidovorax cattleyae]|uniref:peptidoglycan recognition protein family protein n=1 Tax=Paracidovorax cattleyae TaxID=80868 RepID=UPI0018AF7862|nr:peptidoglycan recognition family protein [Paracidovorax cattleyae]MBF9266277.1 N-acetylmuramoyl-L-alanine amidase [Paracidovorax cattleyae]
MNIVNGIVCGTRVLNYRYPNLEHGELRRVNAIVLHQTNSSSAVPTLIAYLWRGVGAHFLISPAGLIYQTARLDRVCHHVGMIRSRCFESDSCAPSNEHEIKQIISGSGSQAEKRLKIHQMEMAKLSGSRFPTNLDSIGIELSGASKDGVYGAPTSAQNAASVWLVNELLKSLGLVRADVYRHPNIAYKQPSEAAQVAY